MPNHTQNRLTIKGSSTQIENVLSRIASLDEEGNKIEMDFNKIIPMPKGMENETHSGVEMWIKICTGQLNFKAFLANAQGGKSFGEAWVNNGFDDMLNYMQSSTAFETLLGDRPGNMKTFSEEDLEHFIQGIRNYRDHGFIGWHGWSIKHWGTKWNAYNMNDERNTADTIYFQTANGRPIPVIAKLSEVFPNVILILSYADEDSGSNAGCIVFNAGIQLETFQPENQSKEAYDMYFELHPGTQEEYKLVGDKYEYIETED
jgi:hypothetical protein